jgi:hypothetical protein
MAKKPNLGYLRMPEVDQVAQLDQVDQVAQLDQVDQVAQLDQVDQVAQLDQEEEEEDRSWRRRLEQRQEAARAEAEAFSEHFLTMLNPTANDTSLAMLAAGALTGLLARKDSPCAMNPQAIGETAAEYAFATLKALKKQQVEP